MTAWLLVGWVWVATILFAAAVLAGPDRLGELALCIRRWWKAR